MRFLGKPTKSSFITERRISFKNVKNMPHTDIAITQE
jgi:hypothetical protein